ncbi:MAG: ATP-dependent DNA ligase, partial [Syntrophaceae bacterium]
MQRFTDLYFTLDEATKTAGRVEALKRYFAGAPPADAAWPLCFLIGEKTKRTVPAARLREWACTAAGIPGWLFHEC